MASVLILGAASDMAIALADVYAAKEYDVMLAARNCNRLSNLASDLKIKYNVNTVLAVFDALKLERFTEFFESLHANPDITICVFGYLVDQEKGMDDRKDAENIIHYYYTGAVSILNIDADLIAKE